MVSRAYERPELKKMGLDVDRNSEYKRVDLSFELTEDVIIQDVANLFVKGVINKRVRSRHIQHPVRKAKEPVKGDTWFSSIFNQVKDKFIKVKGLFQRDSLTLPKVEPRKVSLELELIKALYTVSAAKNRDTYTKHLKRFNLTTANLSLNGRENSKNIRVGNHLNNVKVGLTKFKKLLEEYKQEIIQCDRVMLAAIIKEGVEEYWDSGTFDKQDSKRRISMTVVEVKRVKL